LKYQTDLIGFVWEDNINMITNDLLQIKYPLILDGGLSNVLEQQGCNLNHKLWSAELLVSDPESIVQAHIAYLNAGAQCITTSSYQASVPGFMALGYDRVTAENHIVKSCLLAEEAVNYYTSSGDKGVKPFIAASIGPYGAFLADGSEYHGDYGVSDEILREFHLDRINILDDTNADFFACETIPSYQEAKVLAEILKDTAKTAWVSFSCKDEHHISDGTKIEECATLFTQHKKVFALGVNCTDPKYVSVLIKSIKASGWGKKIAVYPNSGEDYNAKNKTWSGISTENLYLDLVKEWLELGVDIIGGCCRVGPDDIKQLSKILRR
jgi:homocysteine S-methyltransferase